MEINKSNNFDDFLKKIEIFANSEYLIIDKNNKIKTTKMLPFYIEKFKEFIHYSKPNRLENSLIQVLKEKKNFLKSETIENKEEFLENLNKIAKKCNLIPNNTQSFIKHHELANLLQEIKIQLNELNLDQTNNKDNEPKDKESNEKEDLDQTNNSFTPKDEKQTLPHTQDNNDIPHSFMKVIEKESEPDLSINQNVKNQSLAVKKSTRFQKIPSSIKSSIPKIALGVLMGGAVGAAYYFLRSSGTQELPRIPDLDFYRTPSLPALASIGFPPANSLWNPEDKGFSPANYSAPPEGNETYKFYEELKSRKHAYEQINPEPNQDALSNDESSNPDTQDTEIQNPCDVSTEEIKHIDSKEALNRNEDQQTQNASTEYSHYYAAGFIGGLTILAVETGRRTINFLKKKENDNDIPLEDKTSSLKNEIEQPSPTIKQPKKENKDISEQEKTSKELVQWLQSKKDQNLINFCYEILLRKEENVYAITSSEIDRCLISLLSSVKQFGDLSNLTKRFDKRLASYRKEQNPLPSSANEEDHPFRVLLLKYKEEQDAERLFLHFQNQDNNVLKRCYEILLEKKDDKYAVNYNTIKYCLIPLLEEYALEGKDMGLRRIFQSKVKHFQQPELLLSANEEDHPFRVLLLKYKAEQELKQKLDDSNIQTSGKFNHQPQQSLNLGVKETGKQKQQQELENIEQQNKELENIEEIENAKQTEDSEEKAKQIFQKLNEHRKDLGELCKSIFLKKDKKGKYLYDSNVIDFCFISGSENILKEKDPREIRKNITDKLKSYKALELHSSVNKEDHPLRTLFIEDWKQQEELRQKRIQDEIHEDKEKSLMRQQKQPTIPAIEKVIEKTNSEQIEMQINDIKTLCFTDQKTPKIIPNIISNEFNLLKKFMPNNEDLYEKFLKECEKVFDELSEMSKNHNIGDVRNSNDYKHLIKRAALLRVTIMAMNFHELKQTYAIHLKVDDGYTLKGLTLQTSNPESNRRGRFDESGILHNVEINSKIDQLISHDKIDEEKLASIIENELDSIKNQEDGLKKMFITFYAKQKQTKITEDDIVKFIKDNPDLISSLNNLEQQPINDSNLIDKKSIKPE